MIKINLLGDETVIDSSKRLMALGFVGSLCVAIALVWGVNLQLSSVVSDLVSQQESLDVSLKSLQEQTKTVAALEKKRDELAQKVRVIARLKLSKRGPVRLLDDINTLMPAKVWITNMRETNGSLSLQGIGLDNPVLAEYMKALESSEYFKDIKLGGSDKVYLVRDAVAASSKSKSSDTDEAVFGLKTYEALSPEQREAFVNNRPGVGLEVQQFTLNSEVTYVGKTRLREIEDQEKRQQERTGAPAANSTKRS
jgi:type IV pilus assembly protein PilN